MTDIAYLNGKYLPLTDAKISVLDRGFLFGDGIYEVIPVHRDTPVALNAHLQRLITGMQGIAMQTDDIIQMWRKTIAELIVQNRSSENAYQGLYLQVTRGADVKRHHSFPVAVDYTYFAFMFPIPAPPEHDRQKVSKLRVALAEDLRWQRCHIKSTSLLGNVLHFQQGKEEGLAETILYNSQGLVTEASACNVFMVKDGTVITAPLDNQILPGITRALVLAGIRNHSDIHCVERHFSVAELKSADEVWLTSSTKEIAPVSHVDGHQIGEGEVGETWLKAIQAFNKIKFD